MVLVDITRDALPRDKNSNGRPFDRFKDMTGANVYSEIKWDEVSRAAANNHRVKEVIDAEMNRNGKKAKRAMKAKAWEMSNQLTKGFWSTAISMLSSSVDLIGHQVYSGIYLEVDEYEYLQETAKLAQREGISLVFLPSHKSHIDYMALHYMLFRIGISLPCVAAGDNLNLPMVGEILQRSGAFFIRRSFGGSDGNLYTAVVYGFMEELLKRGVNLEFFPEGGRSRTGKLLQPKVGLVGNVFSAVLDGHAKDAIIVPISVQYDRLMEGHEYARELMGAKKQKETVTGMMEQVRSLLTVGSPLGGVHIRISKGWRVRDYVKEYLGRKQSAFSPTDVMHRIALYKSAAYKVMDDINSISTVTPTGVVATVLLTTRGRGVGREELIHKSEWLKREIESNGGHVCWPSTLASSDVIDNSLNVMRDLIESNMYLEPIYSVANHLELSFYRNSVIHIFVEKSIIAASLHSFMRHEPHRKFVNRSELIKRTGMLSNLLKTEFVFSGKSDRIKDAFFKNSKKGSGAVEVAQAGPEEKETALELNFRLATESLVDAGTIQLDPEDKDKILLFSTDTELWSPEYTFMCMLVWPVIESYWLAMAGIVGVFCNRGEKNARKQRALAEQLIQEETFVKQLQAFGLTLFHLGNLNFYESVSKESLRHALATYTEMGAIQKREVEDMTKTSVRYLELGSEMRADINKLYALEENIRMFRRQGKFQKALESYPEHLAGIAFAKAARL
eukprot:TRINITY_DN5124_c1_g1_i1.p1 TRINITY_DN5124_c1_g1~~TRINITY_DN5124_c1_g1_i1.p1  ORF type:complete len:731 (+),score=332.71 TRINITY_DN5124_c1_g1_i1:55-2247(+)